MTAQGNLFQNSTEAAWVWTKLDSGQTCCCLKRTEVWSGNGSTGCQCDGILLKFCGTPAAFIWCFGILELFIQLGWYFLVEKKLNTQCINHTQNLIHTSLDLKTSISYGGYHRMFIHAKYTEYASSISKVCNCE